MKILAGLCPTYKRPEMLANALACWLAQDYDPIACRLFILDDANQFDQQSGVNWELHVTGERYPTLTAKYSALIAMADAWGADGYVLWEDDDVFLSHRLSQINEAFQSGVQFFHPATVLSDYGHKPDGATHTEPAGGRFHSSWAFTREACNAIGGYGQTSRLDFDQQLGSRLRRATGDQPSNGPPAYVYRWGRGAYNGSQAGEAGYKSLWDRIGAMKAPRIGQLVPWFDEQTRGILEKLSVTERKACA